jgi:hypothetical protein
MSTLNPTPQATARVIVQQIPDIGQGANLTLDTAVINPIILLGGTEISSVYNQVLSQTRRIAASDTNVTFDFVGNPVLIFIVGTGLFKLRLASGETQVTTKVYLIGGDGGSLGTVPFRIDGNGTTPVDVTVYVLSKS